MIYVCIATHNHMSTVGLLLWKIRRVFQEFPREYHILVVDDASSDGTVETLETYQRALPMTVVPAPNRRGYAASIEALLQESLRRTDRPKRDCVVMLPADFGVSPAALPELVKRFESGADVVVGEATDGAASLGMRLVRRTAPWLLRPGLSLPGLRDLISGVCVVRLVTLKNCFRDRPGTLLDTDGGCAHAELVARVASSARQIVAIPVSAGSTRLPARSAGPENAMRLAFNLFRAGRRLSIPAPAATIQRV